MKNQRLIYWSAVTLLTAMLVYTYHEYKDQEALVDRVLKTSNRQLELAGKSHKKIIESMKMRHQANIIHMEHHHRQEIGECVEFYTRALEEVKNGVKSKGN